MCFFQTFFSDTAVGLSEGVADFGHYIDAFEVLDQHVVGLKAEAQPAAEAEADAGAHVEAEAAYAGGYVGIVDFAARRPSGEA